jgi:threonine dehydratase
MAALGVSTVAEQMRALGAPTVSDILAARNVIKRYLPETPAIEPPALAAELGFEVVLKLENLQPIGAFKLRGGINLISQLTPEQRARGVVTASTGNHAQSVSYAARLFGTRAVVYMPTINNPAKVAATRRLGGEVIEFGEDFDTCRLEAERHAEREGMRHIHPANEPALIAGVGTYALELIERAPALDAVIVPVGGGSGVCGTAIVFKTLRPETQVIAVQTAAMPAVYRSFHERRLVSLGAEAGKTFAEGLATRVAFEMPYEIMQRLVDDVVVVSEEELRQALVMLLDKAHVVAEGAGAAPLAAARQLAPHLQGKRVGLIVSGGNMTIDTLTHALCDEGSW